MRDRLILILLAVLLLAGGAWLVSATEWVDVDVPTPAKGEALTNPLYATEKLLGALGAKVVRHKSLDAMPPPQARLVLVSRNWDLFPERKQRLRAWVAQGGHLVIPGFLAGHESLKAWLPITEQRPLKFEPPAIPPRPLGKPAKDTDCRALEEPADVTPSYGDSRVFRACGAYFGLQYLPVNRQAAPLWALQGTAGIEAVRVQVGQGTVTVLGGWGLLNNSNLLRADNALLAAAALQARAGAEFWFVAEEAREPFAPWLWHQAWAALLLGLLALALALWRAGVRFGPLAPSAPPTGAPWPSRCAAPRASCTCTGPKPCIRPSFARCTPRPRGSCRAFRSWTRRAAPRRSRAPPAWMRACSNARRPTRRATPPCWPPTSN
jgi:hypothetical protein